MLKVLSVFFCLLYALCLPLGKAYGQSSASEPGNQPILMRVNEWYDEVKKKPKQSYEVLKAKPGVMHGVFDLWYPNGVKKTKGHYEKGKPSGIWENYYENGKLKSAGPLDAHGSRGHWKFYNENGHINREGTLNGDIKEGHWKFYGEGGKLTHEGYYQNGKLHGAWKYYKPDGSLKARADYKMGRGIYTELHNNGAPASRGLVVNGQSDSIWQYFTENGSLKAKGREKNGIKDGPWQYFYPSGKTESEGDYDMGKTSGNWKYYYENGQVSSEGVLKDGKKEGDWKLWYESGKFLGEGSYSGGNGIYKEYYENGKLKLTGQMQDGEHAGEWMYYYDDGTIEGTCEYNNGVGNYTGYYQSGQLRMQGKLINGKKTGAWNMYREDGTRAAILRFYSDGEAPNAGVTELQDTSHNKVDKPYNPAVLKLTKKGNRFYSRQVNEQHGIILSFNPLGAIPLPFGLGKQGVPFSVEYRIRERLAYEFTYTFFRSPVFANHENPDPNTTLYEGFNISLRQKLCFPENDRAGSLYYGQEIRYTEVFYNTLVQDPLLPQVTLPYTGLEKKYELSFLLGMRFYKELSGKGNTAFTADLFTGLGAGIRKTNFPGKQVAFNELNRSKFTFPIRLGFTVGMFF